jgi:hypothetical protein
MENTEALLTKARRNFDLGRLKEAATQLEAAYAQTKERRVLSELADVLISQGYWQKASNILEEELKGGDNHAEGNIDNAGIQMKLCSIRPVIDCFFGQSIVTAESLHRKYLLHLDWSTASRDEVRA